jgi:rhombotail lipoprotein
MSPHPHRGSILRTCRRPGSLIRFARAIFVVLAAGAVLAACASMEKTTKQRQVASMLAYLFPGSEQPAVQPDTVAVLNIPFRVGVAFVPDNGPPEFRLSEAERLRLAGQVRDVFASYPFISQIEAVPSLYLEAGGGFANLERVASLLRLDVIALISFDQAQFSGASGWSFLYWTGVGAYVVEGDMYDVLTAVETAVFDVRSRRMLMHASGTSTVKGSATWVGFAERSRNARVESFGTAVQQMTTNLQREVQAFRERAPTDPKIRLVLPPGYKPGTPPPVPPPR